MNGNGTSAAREKGSLAIFVKERNWKKWTAVNDEAVHAIADDDDAEEYRMLALAFLRTWGNPNDPQDAAVDGSGKRMRPTDFARELGVSDQTVSRWVGPLAAKNLLHLLDSGVYPVPVPSKPFPMANNGRTHFQTPGKNPAKWLIFKEERKRTHPDKIRRLEELRAELRTLNTEELAAYKAWLKSQESGNNGTSGFQTPEDSVPDSDDSNSRLREPINKERARDEENNTYTGAGSSSSSSSPEPSPEPKISTTTTTNANPPKEGHNKESSGPSEVDSVIAALGTYCKPEKRKAVDLVAACRLNDPDCTTEEIVDVIHEKGKHIRNAEMPLAFAVKAVSNCFADGAYRHIRAAQAALIPGPGEELSLDEQIKVTEDFLSAFQEDGHPDVPYFERQLAELKAKKAGQP